MSFEPSFLKATCYLGKVEGLVGIMRISRYSMYLLSIISEMELTSWCAINLSVNLSG
jgi:hypothetical protein